MTDSGFDRSLTRAGFVLILLALVTGLAVPAFLNARMAVAAHLGGIMNGLLLIVIGATWSRLALSQGHARITRVAVLAAAYANWGTACLAAAWGTSRLTPLSGAGFAAAAWQESVVQALQVCLAIAIVGAVAMIVYGLRPRAWNAQAADLPGHRGVCSRAQIARRMVHECVRLRRELNGMSTPRWPTETT